MGSKFWLIAVLHLAVSVGLEGHPIDSESDDLLDNLADLADRDGLYENYYEMGYPDNDDDAADDNDDGNELQNFNDDSEEMEDSGGALDEMGLEDPRWGQALGLQRPRNRRSRSSRRRRRKAKRKRQRGRGGSMLSVKSSGPGPQPGG